MNRKQGRTIDRSTGEVREGTVRPFADILHDLGKGQVADEASILLTDLVQAVVTYGKPGTFSLRITVAPLRGNTRQVTVSATAKSSPPEAEPVAAVFFADDAGNLSRNDPRIEPMFELREVAHADADLRDVR